MKISKNIVLANTLAISYILLPVVAYAQQEAYLGGIDVDTYCKDRFGGTARAELDPNEKTAWGWRCRIGRDLVTICMDNACRFQYKNQRAFSRPKDSRNPYSWECFAN